MNKELKKLYEDYAKKYNRLSRKMEKANIDIKLLNELEQATIELYTKDEGSIYVTGIGEALKELVDILNKNHYLNSLQFKEELLSALKQKTGNENLSTLCSCIIDNLEKDRGCNENIS